MTPEEVDKKIELILQIQAQFESNQEKLADNVRRTEHNVHELRQSVAELRIFLAEFAQSVRDSIQFNGDRNKRLEDIVTEVAQAHAELARIHKEGEERLNSLIHVVERHVSGPGHDANP